MIFVTVGTHRQGFERLVKAADELASQINEKVIIQRGSAQYEPRFAEHFQWTGPERMESLTSEARIVITHAAAGAIIYAIRMNKPIILSPRLKRYKEHATDHQQQIAKALSEQGRALVVEDPIGTTLRQAVEQISAPIPVESGPVKLISALQEQIAAWEAGPNQTRSR